MIDHYNAFISYRHAEKDIQVAKAVQHDLEHFHIPAKIRKETGTKRINRIFLDKDELGAASDLSSEISFALEHADHLIVICSTATRESRWVPREIEYFLRNHTRRQITTVLVDGEPEDVIPDILKYEDRTFVNENGMSYTVRVPLEPLSCDYRLPRRQAKKTELPRLASKLLSCSYDELMNRRRAYKIRRLTAIFAVIMALAIGFGAYLLYSRNEIHQNLQNSKRNQSIYLANEALHALEDEHRILSMQLALEALPKDAEDDRPVTPEAIRAITDSTLSYTTRSGYNIEDVCNYRMRDKIRDDGYALSPSGHNLVVWDMMGNLSLWDTVSHNQLLSITVENLCSAVFLSDTKLLVVSNKKIYVYNTDNGSLVWDRDSGETSFPTSNTNCPVFADGSFLVLTGKGEILRMASSDGTLVATYQLPVSYEDTSLSYSRLQLSPDETRIAGISTLDATSSVLSIYNISTGQIQHKADIGFVSRFLWTDDTHIVTASPANPYASSTSFGYYSYVQTDHVTIQCFETNQLTERWNRDFTSTNVMIESNFLLLPKNNAVLFYHGNIAQIFRVDDGNILATHNTNESIVYAIDPDGDGWPFYITSGGGLAFPKTTESLGAYYFFEDHLSNMLYSPNIGFFSLTTGSSEVLQYGLYQRDEDFHELGAGKDLGTLPDNMYFDSSVLAIITQESAEKFPELAEAGEEKLMILTIIDSSAGELRFQMPIREEEILYASSIEFLGTRYQHLYLGYTVGNQGYRVMDVDLDTGEQTYINLIQDGFASRRCCALADGKFYYYNNNGDSRNQLYAYDIDSKTTESFKITDSDDYIYVKNSPIIIPLQQVAFLTFEHDKVQESVLVHLDGSGAEYLTVPEGWETSVFAADPAHGRYALSDNNNIRILSPGEDDPVMIHCPATPYGMSFYSTGKKGEPTYLLVAYNNGELFRYNSEDGTLLSKSNLLAPNRGVDFLVDFHFEPEKNLLFLTLDQSMTVYETDSWYPIAELDRGLGYNRISDRFYSVTNTEDSEFAIGYFKRYTVEDLVEKARKHLQGAEMSEDERAEYGLEP